VKVRETLGACFSICYKVIVKPLALTERGRTGSKGIRFSDPTPEVLEIKKESVIFEAKRESPEEKALH
jgi:hypothetical protein